MPRSPLGYDLSRLLLLKLSLLKLYTWYSTLLPSSNLVLVLIFRPTQTLKITCFTSYIGHDWKSIKLGSSYVFFLIGFLSVRFLALISDICVADYNYYFTLSSLILNIINTSLPFKTISFLLFNGFSIWWLFDVEPFVLRVGFVWVKCMICSTSCGFRQLAGSYCDEALVRCNLTTGQRQ